MSVTARAEVGRQRAGRQKVWTYDDLLKIPWDGKRREILDGVLEVVPAPFIRHQRTLGNLYRPVDAHVRKHKLGEVFFAPVDYVLDPTNVLDPDLIFVSNRRRKLVTEKNISGGVPDLVVEVVSELKPTRDTVRKRAIYERFGVPNVWFLYPGDRILEELVLKRGRYVTRSVVTGNGIFRPAVFPKLAIDLKKIWPK